MITVDQFNTIVMRLREGKLSQRKIAREERVSRTTVTNISRRRHARQNRKSPLRETLGTIKTGRCPECNTPYPKDVTDCVVCAARAAKDLLPSILEVADDAGYKADPLPQLLTTHDKRRARIRIRANGSRRGRRETTPLKDVPSMRNLAGSVRFEHGRMEKGPVIALCVPAIE